MKKRFLVLSPSSLVCSFVAFALLPLSATKAENIHTTMWIAPVASPATGYHYIACTSSQENACAAQLNSCMKPVDLIRDPEKNKSRRCIYERAETRFLERCG